MLFYVPPTRLLMESMDYSNWFVAKTARRQILRLRSRNSVKRTIDDVATNRTVCPRHIAAPIDRNDDSISGVTRHGAVLQVGLQSNNVWIFRDDLASIEESSGSKRDFGPRTRLSGTYDDVSSIEGTRPIILSEAFPNLVGAAICPFQKKIRFN